jgi:hypothetical protein
MLYIYILRFRVKCHIQLYYVCETYSSLLIIAVMASPSLNYTTTMWPEHQQFFLPPSPMRVLSCTVSCVLCLVYVAFGSHSRAGLLIAMLACPSVRLASHSSLARCLVSGVCRLWQLSSPLGNHSKYRFRKKVRVMGL